MSEYKILRDKFFTPVAIIFGSLLFFAFQFDLLMPNNDPPAEVIRSYYAMKSYMQPLMGTCVIVLIVLTTILKRREAKHGDTNETSVS